MNLLFVDTETGGLDPSKHSLLEAHFVAYKNGEILGELHLPIKHCMYSVTSKALEINKINLATHEGYDIQYAHDQLKLFLLEHFHPSTEPKPHMAGHNVMFDKGFIKEQLFNVIGADIDNYIHYRSFDTQSLIMTLQMIGKLPYSLSTGLHKVANHLGIDTGVEHSARDDVYTTIKVYEKLLSMIQT